jgi:hypothetical protein
MTRNFGEFAVSMTAAHSTMRENQDGNSKTPEKLVLDISKAEP